MKRLLLVDDDPDILESLRMLLEESYAVEIATNGEAGLHALLARDFDAVVLDMMMPVLDGAGLLRELRERGVRVPVLLASAARDLKARARELAAEDFIEKPFDPATLEAKLARITSGGAPGGGGPPRSGAGEDHTRARLLTGGSSAV